MVLYSNSRDVWEETLRTRGQLGRNSGDKLEGTGTGQKGNTGRNKETWRKEHRNPRDETVSMYRRTIMNMRVGTVGRY